jgi:hypothetical protein
VTRYERDHITKDRSKSRHHRQIAKELGCQTSTSAANWCVIWAYRRDSLCSSCTWRTRVTHVFIKHSGKSYTNQSREARPSVIKIEVVTRSFARSLTWDLGRMMSEHRLFSYKTTTLMSCASINSVAVRREREHEESGATIFPERDGH